MPIFHFFILQEKLSEIDVHIESVKRISEDLEKLAMSGSTAFAIPSEIVSQLQSLRQGLVLQRQTADSQRVQWIQRVDQHIHFVSDFLSTYNLVVSLTTESTRSWNVFVNVCKVLPPNTAIISWTRENSLYGDRLHEILNLVIKLNERFPLMCASEDGDGEETISASRKKLIKFLKAFEEVAERRQSVLDRIWLSVNEFNRDVQRFSQALETLTTNLHQILGASVEPTNLVLSTLLEDFDSGLSQDLNNLKQERSSLQNLMIEACELTAPNLEQPENDIDEGIKWEKKAFDKMEDPPENRTLNVTKIIDELTETKDSLITSINVSFSRHCHKIWLSSRRHPCYIFFTLYVGIFFHDYDVICRW